MPEEEGNDVVERRSSNDVVATNSHRTSLYKKRALHESNLTCILGPLLGGLIRLTNADMNIGPSCGTSDGNGGVDKKKGIQTVARFVQRGLSWNRGDGEYGVFPRRT